MRIPLTVIGGYLGAGKTTLLNHLLRESSGRRLAVLVNDFGALNIDAALIEGDVVTLENGCVCCSLSNGLATALHQVAQMDPPPEHVLVEASGVSDPARVSAFGSMAPFSPDGIVVVADAETIEEKSRDVFVGDSVQIQLRSADLVVLNKTDLVSPERAAELRSWLGGRVLETTYGQVPLARLLGLSPGLEVPAGEPSHGYRSWSWQSARPLDRARLESLLGGWPESVLRAKGILHLGEDRRYVFQRVGARWTLTPDRPWGAEAPASKLVLIGLEGQLDGTELISQLEGVP
jgi:G3E family GTPase